jgi:hypothetical protein
VDVSTIDPIRRGSIQGGRFGAPKIKKKVTDLKRRDKLAASNLLFL